MSETKNILYFKPTQIHKIMQFASYIFGDIGLHCVRTDDLSACKVLMILLDCIQYPRNIVFQRCESSAIETLVFEAMRLIVA